MMRETSLPRLRSKTMIALILVTCLIAVPALSLASPAGGVGGVGGAVGGHGGDHYDERPDPFHFQYGVHDDKYYTDVSEVRSGDEAGNIKGEYSVALPDGRIQHVIYLADGNYGGTVMDVKYDGEAHHPDVVHHGGHGAGLVSGGVGVGLGRG